MKRLATLSECGTFRAALTREFEPGCELNCCRGFRPSRHGFISWVLNNPSTADADVDDPTVKRAWAYTKRWGYGAMMFVNTNPWRSADPTLARVSRDPEVWRINDQWLMHAMQVSALTLCGWGDKADPDLARRTFSVLHTEGPVHALRITKAGNPQHPLYLPGALVPQLWKGERYHQ